jgi:hypothetical protein
MESEVWSWRREAGDETGDYWQNQPSAEFHGEYQDPAGKGKGRLNGAMS